MTLFFSWTVECPQKKHVLRSVDVCYDRFARSFLLTMIIDV